MARRVAAASQLTRAELELDAKLTALKVAEQTLSQSLKDSDRLIAAAKATDDSDAAALFAGQASAAAERARGAAASLNSLSDGLKILNNTGTQQQASIVIGA